jgi:hypothetical protein
VFWAAGTVMYVVNVLLNVLVLYSLAPPGRLVGDREGGLCVVAVTGQMVVYTGTTSVVTLPSFPGQLVTVGAHEVTV